MSTMFRNGIIVAILAVAVGAFGIVWLTSHQKMASETNVVQKFTKSAEQVRIDMQNRYVIIPPVGQLWAFTPDQKVELSVLQIKSEDNGVAVYAKVASTAVVQPPQDIPEPESEIKSSVPPAGKAKDVPKAPAPPPPALPVTVHLSGVIKLHYELIADEWYLVDISSVNVQATQK